MRACSFFYRPCSWRAAKAEARRGARAVEPVVGQERLAKPAAWPATEPPARPRPPDAVVRRPAVHPPRPDRPEPAPRWVRAARRAPAARPVRAARVRATRRARAARWVPATRRVRAA